MAADTSWVESSESLGTSYSYTRLLKNVNYTLTVQTNGTRATYLSISAVATSDDAKPAAKQSAINTLINDAKSFIADHSSTDANKAF